MSSIEFWWNNHMEIQSEIPVQKTGISDINLWENLDITLNNKISEIFDTFDDISKQKLSNNDKNNLKTQLLNLIKNEKNPKNILDWYLLTIKESDSDITISELSSIIWVNQDVKEVQSDVVNINKWKESLNEDKKLLFWKLKEILNWVDLKWKESKIILNLLESKEDDRFDKVISIFKNNQVIFDSVVWELREKDPKKYKDFVNTLREIDPSLEKAISNFELKYVESLSKLKLWTDNLSWVDLSKSKLVKNTDDWFSIEAGQSDRSLSLTWSNYKLDSKLNNSEITGEFEDINKKTLEELKPLNEIIYSIQKIIDYLDKAILNKTDIKEVKEAIKNSNLNLYNELNLENINSLDQIKQILTWYLKKKEDEKDEKIKVTKKKINELISKNIKEAREKDKKKKEVLTFLHEIWFDLLPQTETDYVINQINSRPDRMWLFDSDIDLKNGELWNRSLWWWISVDSKVKFTDLLSNMVWLTWDDKLDYYKTQRWFFWSKVESYWIWADWFKKYINSTLWEDSKITWQELLNNLLSSKN